MAATSTPKPVVDLLYREVARALKMPDVIERLATQGGNELVGNTPAEFGDYISIYNFKQSVEDNATVPLYYENRIPEVELANKNLNPELESVLERAELDTEEESKLAREFPHEYDLITRDERLEKIAEDLIVEISLEEMTQAGEVLVKLLQIWACEGK